MRRNHLGLVLLLAGILITASFLRFYRFSNSYGYFGDQGQDLIAAHDWITTGKIPVVGILTSIGSFHMGPLYYYLITPLVWFFNGEAFAPVLLFLFSGILLVVISFYLALRFADLPTAIILATLTGLSPHLIFLSKGAYIPNLQPFIFVVMLYFFFQFLKTKKYLYLFLSYLSVGVGVQFHYTFLANLPTLVLAMLFFSRKEAFCPKACWAFFGFFLPLLPFIVGQFFLQFADFRGIVEYLLHSSTSYPPIILRTILDKLTFPFVIYFPPDGLPWYLNFFYQPLVLIFLIYAIWLSHLTTFTGFFTRVVLFFFLINLVQSVIGRLQFWWWYNDYYAYAVLILVAAVISRLYQSKRWSIFWLPVLAIFLWWEIFNLSDVYKIPRTPYAVTLISSEIIQDVKNRKVNSEVGLMVISPTTLREAFEHRYLLEQSGVKTFSAKGLGEADYVVIEKDKPARVVLSAEVEGLNFTRVADLKFNDEGTLIKYAEVLRAEK